MGGKVTKAKARAKANREPAEAGACVALKRFLCLPSYK